MYLRLKLSTGSHHFLDTQAWTAPSERVKSLLPANNGNYAKRKMFLDSNHRHLIWNWKSWWLKCCTAYTKALVSWMGAALLLSRDRSENGSIFGLCWTHLCDVALRGVTLPSSLSSSASTPVLSVNSFTLTAGRGCVVVKSPWVPQLKDTTKDTLEVSVHGSGGAFNRWWLHLSKCWLAPLPWKWNHVKVQNRKQNKLFSLCGTFAASLSL